MISRRTICGVIGVLLPMIALIQPASGQVAPTVGSASAASSQSSQNGQSSQNSQNSQSPESSGAPPERLSLDAAISLAVAHNRGLASANSQVAKATADLAAAKTRRLPSFEANVSASYC